MPHQKLFIPFVPENNKNQAKVRFEKVFIIITSLQRIFDHFFKNRKVEKIERFFSH